MQFAAQRRRWVFWDSSFFIDSIRVQYYLRLSHKKTKEQNK